MKHIPLCKSRPAIAVLAAMLAGSGFGFAQTSPTPQSLPLSQNFGTTTFTTMPAGFAVWNGVSGGSVSSQTLAEASAPTGNATIATATAVTTTGGAFGYMVGGNARPYIQTSSNATNGVNQVAMALNCSGFDNIVVGYEVEVISAQPRTVGVVCQYRIGSTGSWTTLTPTTGSNPYSQAGGTTGIKSTVQATLPSAANNQPVVQVRWALWRGTETGNSSGIGIDNVSATGTPTGDVAPPTISTLTPADDATGVSATTNLVALFNEPIVKGTGDITLKLVSDNSTVFTIPVTGAAVAVAGSTATITLPSSLAGLTGYYVNIASGAFKDLANNNFAGIADATTWNFTTTSLDVTPPAITALSPADGSSTVFPAANLSITYDETVIANSGSIVIKKLSDDSIVETIPVPGSLVSVSGAVVSINPSAVLDYGTSYYVEIAANTFRDAATNGTLAVTGNTTWDFTTRALPAVLISQYHEGANTDRFIELRNTTGSPLSLNGYKITTWSNSDIPGREGWKSGTDSTPRVTLLDGYTIPANGRFLIAEPIVTIPSYAANNFDLATDAVNLSATDFNGDDSVVLYQGAGFTREEVVDAVGFTANQGADISIYRLNATTQGFDFNSGTSFLNFSSTWATKTITEVSSASITDEWYLQASQPPKVLTLSVSPTSFSEGAGAAAATATVTRSGDTSAELTVDITINDPSEASAAINVLIPIGASSAQFQIDAVNDPYKDGDKPVNVTVSTAGFTPASQTITVLDELADPFFPVVINEVDADQTATDSNEFIELYNTSNAAVSLDGMVVVLYNGNNDLSYMTIDLTGQTIGANDYLVIGSSTVPNVDMTEFGSEGIQNGPDAVALYIGNVVDFPNNTPVSTSVGTLVDALVYDTDDADDTGLISALTPGKPQINENETLLGATHSMSRLPNGGANFDTSLYVIQTPTPGATNVIAGYSTWATTNAGGQTGDLDFDNDGVENGIEYFMNAAAGFTANPGVVAGAVTWTNGGNLLPADYGTKFYLQTSGNLSTWTNVASDAPGLVNNTGALTYTLPTGTGPLFVRLVVITP